MNGFSGVSYKTRVFEKKFGERTEESRGIYYTATSVSVSGVTPVRFYNADGEIYVYCADKSVVKVANNAVVSANFSSDVPPIIAPVMINGVKTTLFISDVGAKAGGETLTGVPYGKSCAFCADRLFIACTDRIKYSTEFDYTDFTTGLTFGGFIKTDDADGEVLFLAEDGGKLYAVCKRAVYVIKPYGEEYGFYSERISAFALDVKENTVFKTGNRICFISGNDLCVMVGGKIKVAGDALSALSVTAFGYAGGNNGLYVLPVTVGDNRYVYAYDTVKDAEILQLAGDYTVFGGYAVKTGAGTLYEISDRVERSTVAETYSGEYDFGTCAKKAVCKVEAHISGSAEISVTGDGVFRALLTEKCNAVSCFVHGRSFAVSFENASEDFRLYRLTVHYVIYGE